MKVATQVIKRDGVIAQFDNNRIYLAIQKAANAASQTVENIEDESLNKSFGVIWSEKDEYNNAYQSSSFEDDENILVIKVKKG